MHRLLSIIATMFVMSGCGHAQNADEPAPASANEHERYVAAASRVVEMAELGQVVSRTQEGAPERVGEALLWTWTALGNLDCGDGHAMFSDTLGRMQFLNGNHVRYLPLPAEYADGNEISIDSEIGYWYGTASRAKRCPDDAGALAEAFQSRRRAIAVNGGHLHPNVSDRIPAGFGAVEEQVGSALGLNDAPSGAAMEALGAELTAWVAGTVTLRGACFRLNLAWDVLRALDYAGRPIGGGWRDLLCGTTATVDIPTWDHWCGRPGLDAYLDGFAPNVWEYRHQRCGAWETPDGQGLQTPGLDELVALRLKYGENL